MFSFFNIYFKLTANVIFLELPDNMLIFDIYADIGSRIICWSDLFISGLMSSCSALKSNSGSSFVRNAKYRIGLLLIIGVVWQSIVNHATGQTIPFETISGGVWISAMDTTKVKARGTWRKTAFRYAAEEHLLTHDEDAVLKIDFVGTGLVLRLSGHAVPSYGNANLGVLKVDIDSTSILALHLGETPREIVLARDLSPGEHRVQLHHRRSTAGTGCRVAGVYILRGPTGELAFEVNGEENSHLVDVRAVLTCRGEVIRNTLVRNWLNGQCRLAGLPPGDGYTLQLSASGWEPYTESGIEIIAGGQVELPPVYLRREPRTRTHSVRFPTMGYPVVRLPGDQFRTRLVIYRQTLESLRLVRYVGPATISRESVLEEDTSAAFYYDREFRVTIPDDTPPGLYDLVATICNEWGHTRTVMSPRSVHVVSTYPRNPVFMTFGHLDTWGQYQAEYLRQLAGIANILVPDMVLVSNEVNAAYVSGVLSDVCVPYLVNFGNHQFPGHEHWYGETVGIVDFGMELSVLNFGLYWHDNLSKADALLSAREDTRIKVINGFEHNAPLQSFLDKHTVAMIHDGHGTGLKVMEMGGTPTIRIGKRNSESFRVVRFQNGKVLSATYLGSEVDPIPFRRGEQAPIRIKYSPANDGRHGMVTATVTNDLEETFPNCRAVLVMPHATEFTVDNGQLDHVITSDDGSFAVVTVRFNLPAQDSLIVSVASR